VSKAARIIRQADAVIALTGAGASTESGISDFRSRGGLWSRFDPVEFGTLGAFRSDPARVWRMLAELLAVADATPNRGHQAMAAMERMGRLQGIITQNIDGLHQKAGSRNVVEYHGSLATFSCPACNYSYSLEQVQSMTLPPLCSCGQILKPEVVFFDEAIPRRALEESAGLLANAEVLIVAGTSCRVAPASLIPVTCKRRGGVIIEVNYEPALGALADIRLAGGFARTMDMLVRFLSG
jgi:NAD-dependent deacetylase